MGASGKNLNSLNYVYFSDAFANTQTELGVMLRDLKQKARYFVSEMKFEIQVRMNNITKLQQINWKYIAHSGKHAIQKVQE